MKKITLKELEAKWELGKLPTQQHLLRVGMDTGGIAAGAKEVFDLLQAKVPSVKIAAKVQPTGPLGLSFADPTVEVVAPGGLKVIYGQVTTSCAEKIVADHLGQNRWVHDHIVADRSWQQKISTPTQAILVLDTGLASDSGEKTKNFQNQVSDALAKAALSNVQAVRALDLGVYRKGICLLLVPSQVLYINVQAADLPEIIEKSIRQQQVIDRLLFKQGAFQVKVALRNCGSINPESLEDCLVHGGGYRGLAKALNSTPEQIIEKLKNSGLRGRGGAGFPTWLKWKLTREVPSEAGGQKYIICNADEGDPGAFMDRSVLEGDPHAVLEGMIIAGYTIGASMGYFYIRAEYPMAIERVQQAINEARAAGILGENILGSKFSFNAKIRLGAGAFVCGEETALIASIEGKRGSPSPRPPFPSVKGLFQKPTSINNVETFANIPIIIAEEQNFYAQYGTEKSKGTKVFAVTGKVRYAQLVEVPMGTTLRTVIDEICGGVENNQKIKGVQTGGPSGGVIPERLLDTPISYENLQQLGSIMGSGGMLVVDERDCMVEMAKFYLKFCVDESCGKCAPCRIGGFQILEILEKISKGKGKDEDVQLIERICQAMTKASLCGLGQTAANPVLSTIKYFNGEIRAYIEGGVKYARQKAKELGQ